jgi:D-alanyl-D-alanine carboxypeptidase
MRAVRAAQLLERGFGDNTLTWLRPSLGTVDNLVPIDASPPNLRDQVCGPKRKRPATDEDADTVASNGSASGGESPITFFTAGLQAPMAKPSELMAAAPAASEPVVVYTGPKKTGAALIAAVAVDEQKQATKPRGKKSRVAAKKPDAAAEPKAEAKQAGKEAKSDAKSDGKPAAKPAAVRQAHAKPEAAPKAAEKSAEKPATAKPAKPKTVEKPAEKPAAKPAAKPAPKSSEAKPPVAKPADPKPRG